MLDFVVIEEKMSNNGGMQLIPRFKLNSRVKDVMTRGGAFYAIWDSENECWSQDRDRAYELIDLCIDEYISERREKTGNPNLFIGARIMYATHSDTGVADAFIKYVKSQKDQRYHALDTKVVFKSEPPSKALYSSHRLQYDPIDIATPNYDRLMSVLYSESDRQKIEWLIGVGLAGDNDKVQKFGVIFGNPGTGKGTVLWIIDQLFEGYTTSFEADALGRKSDNFALEPFKNHPVVAIQTDGNLSRIEDNTRLNTLIAHEKMTVNEKFKGKYDTKFDTILFIGTNDDVKITNARSGLLRRLIVIEPTGDKIPGEEYSVIKAQIPFELPGIAYRCRELYIQNPRLYDNYKPIKMMQMTNEFMDFVMEYNDQFMSEEYILLTTAWTWYTKYVEDANARQRLSRREFASELSAYFKSGPHDEWIIEDGTRKHRSSVYRGFKPPKNIDNGSEDIPIINGNKGTNKKDPYEGVPSWLWLRERGKDEKNVFDVYFAGAFAQYAVPNDSGEGSRPKKAWDDVSIKLRAIDSTNEHFVLTQSLEPKLIVIDFDIKDPATGKKSLELNLKAAAKFPKTYAETSKSGNGLHLHYIYDGDTDELSMLYDENIEIKVFKGKSALRRRLSLCNNEEIAHLNSGLPLKEVKKKMIDWDVVKDEKHLRACIKKALRREIHANTRPSIDFIKMKTDEAYDSGMHYDVSDMYQAVMNFAAMSTNQSEYCMNLVLEMKFKSEESSDNVADIHNIDKPIAFFDWEVFPNLSIMCYKVAGGVLGDAGKSEVVRLINPTSNQVSEFHSNYRAIGFNNLEYDNHISYARILGWTNQEIYALSGRLIPKDKSKKDLARRSKFNEARNLSYTDVHDFSSVKQSLKRWEIELKMHHQEFPLPWDKPVPEDRWEEAADYCANDVVATEVLFYHLNEDWNARQVLVRLSGLTANDKTNTHSARFIFGSNRNPQSAFNYPDLSKEFPGYEFNMMGIDPERYNKWPDGSSVMTTGKSIFMGDDPSEGGYVYYETGIHRNVALLDIASLHPTTIEVLQLFGTEYTDKYVELKTARVAVKHKDWGAARKLLDGAFIPFLEGVEAKSKEEQQQISDDLSYATKIILNSAYGMTSAQFANAFKDPRNVDNVVAKRGALFMILLKHEVQKKGFTVVHIKTDSIKIADATPEIIAFVVDFGKQYGYSFEHEATYQKMCLVNKAVYIAKYDEEGERTKGGRHANCWTATGAEFQHPYIFKTLFSHEQVTVEDYSEIKEVTGAYIYLDFNEDLIKDDEAHYEKLSEQLETIDKGKMDIRKQMKEVKERMESTHNLVFVGKCGAFIPVEPGIGGGLMVRVTAEGKVGAVTGTKGYRWLESEDVLSRGLMDKIDKSYFRVLVDSAMDHISKFGDADDFVYGN